MVTYGDFFANKVLIYYVVVKCGIKGHVNCKAKKSARYKYYAVVAFFCGYNSPVLAFVI